MDNPFVVGTGGANGNGEDGEDGESFDGLTSDDDDDDDCGGSVKKDGVNVSAAGLCDNADLDGGTGNGGLTSSSAIVDNFLDNATADGRPLFPCFLS
jgi:hypothetical protein